MIGLGKASAGPTENGGIERLELFNKVLAVAVNIRDGRILSNPDTVVYNAADMLGKVAVYLGLDITRFFGVD
jgi:hypothetical protein